MAAQHARAVQLRRREFGDEINQQLAMSIALHMGNDGSPAKLAIITLAEYAPCHYNTADKRTKEMAARGLIKIQKSGKLFLYSIAGDFEDGFTGQAEPPAVDYGDEIELINGRLDRLEWQVENLVKLVTELHTIVTSSSHELHTNFTPTSHDVHITLTPPPYTNVNEEEKKRRREEEKVVSPKPPLPEKPNTPQPPDNNPFPYKPLKEKSKQESPAEKRKQAIIAVCGLDDTIPTHVKEAENATAQLKKYTAEYIQERYSPGGWWYLSDWRGQKGQQPTTSAVIETIAKTVQASSNGHHKTPAPSQGLKEIEPGVY